MRLIYKLKTSLTKHQNNFEIWTVSLIFRKLRKMLKYVVSYRGNWTFMWYRDIKMNDHPHTSQTIIIIGATGRVDIKSQMAAVTMTKPGSHWPRAGGLIGPPGCSRLIPSRPEWETRSLHIRNAINLIAFGKISYQTRLGQWLWRHSEEKVCHFCFLKTR